MEPREDIEAGAAPRARKRVAMGWTALLGGIAVGLVALLIFWLVA